MNKLIKLLLALSLVFALVGCQTADQQASGSNDKVVEQTNEEFAAFLDEYVLDIISSDYQSVHMFFEDPSAYGIDKQDLEVSWGNAEYTAEDKAETEAYKTKLMAFDRDSLDEVQQDCYDYLLYDLDMQLAYMAEDMAYYGSMFGPMTGFYTAIPTNLVDYQIRTEQDYLDLITLVQELPAYFEKVKAYTDKQAELGLVMINYASVLEYCQDIVDNQDDSTILTSLLAKTEGLGLDEATAKDYQEKMQAAYYQGFIQMYSDIIAYLQDLQTRSANNEQGLAYLPAGQEYYELLVKDKTGKDITIEELEEMMQDLYADNMQELMEIVQNDPEILETFNMYIATGFTSYEEILAFLNEHMTTNFPDIGEIAYEIASIDPLIANSGTAAYFNIPAIDQTSPKQIRVNTQDGALDIGNISTYITLAHEGFPGHMYQFAYNYENMPNLFLKVNSNLAFTEGYAVYSSYEAMQYLEDIDEDLLRLYRVNEMLSYAVIVMADIGIHYYGYTLEDFTEFINNAGLQLDEEGYRLQYEQLRDDPAAFIPYYAGYKQIIDLKEQAQEALGDKFDETSFNQALLASGNAPFMIVERHIEDYIANQ